MADKLTLKQRRFIDAYTGEACGNAAEAARIAGYKGNVKTLSMVGRENLEKPAIASVLQKQANRESSKAIATRTEKQEWLTSMMRLELIHPDTGERPTFKDALDAAKILAKMHGDFLKPDEASVKIEYRLPENTPIDEVTAWLDARDDNEQ